MNNQDNQELLDQKYISLALEQAQNGLYTTLPNPRVGCVIVKDSNIIGMGFHKKAGTPHAEVNALADVKAKGLSAEGATAYVTLEPCSHYGLTPPCAKALVDAKVARVVCAIKDPNPLVSGRGIKILEDAGVEVKCSVLEDKAYDINKDFFFAMENERPYVTVKYGMSLDAKVALKNGESKWITSSDSRRDVQRIRALNQAILTTAETVIADNPSMSLRYEELSDEVKANYPLEFIRPLIKVVLDPLNKLLVDIGDKCSNSYEQSESKVSNANASNENHLTHTLTEKLTNTNSNSNFNSTLLNNVTPANINIAQTTKANIYSSEGNVIVVRISSDDQIHEDVVNDNITILNIPSEKENKNHIDLKILLKVLHDKRIRALMVEAGGRFVQSILSQNLVNELVVYVAPKIMGSDGQNAFLMNGPCSMNEVKSMKLVDVGQIGDDVRLTYRL